ncbi:MAG: AAA domain-containing protein [Elusimicrobia bacterium]|nr:AAA domain-containing protein [Elusimicrobiota bacterium]
MTTFRCPRWMKSGIATAVSAALALTSAGGPAGRAYAQTFGASGEAASSARAVTASGSALSIPVAVPNLTPAPLSGALTAPAFASAPALSAAAASADPAAARATSAAALVSPSDSVAPAAPVAAPAASSSEGPRWVESPTAPQTPDGQAGPRWVAPADGRRTFDGEGVRAALTDSVSAAAEDSARATGLSQTMDAERRVIEDHSIPTPEAARRVAQLRHEHGTPLWVKVAAPLSVVAAAAVAIHFGAVPVLTLAAGLVLSVLAHEVAHLAVLKALGDHTAEHAHGSSLNPFHHVDPIKTVMLPALTLALSSAILPFPILIGSGKAVDADFNNLRGPLGGPRSARNAFWVAAAGPLTNFAAALVFGVAAHLLAGGVLAGVAIGLAHMNVALGVFNLIPLPQLDGGKILASLLPEAWYAKWVYNPKVEKGYQGLFRRLYEGPSNLLTFVGDKLGVKSQTSLNRVANGVTFGALAAFYAVAYFHFAVALPLLFLALPCTYDYWCIREKVRSEAAVKDAMDIFSQWSSVIAQIAEDRGMASEVSQFEAEHAMKNALETLIDEMMAKEEFRALSDDEKIAALMAAYPDRAADFLKDKVFTEDADTRERILELLKDQRNTPFYERTRRWLAEHDIFNRWDNPKYEGKLRDQMKEADKPKQKANGQRGSATLGTLLMLGTLGGAAALFPELAHHVPALSAGGLGLLGIMGMVAPNFESSRPTWQSKLLARPGDVSFVLKVKFTAGTSLDAARSALSGYGDSELLESEPYILRLNPGNADDAADIARALAENALVESISVPESVHERLTGTAAAAVDQADGGGAAKVSYSPHQNPSQIVVVFRAGTSREAVRRALSGRMIKTAPGGGSRVIYPDVAAAVAAARRLAQDDSVKSVSVGRPVYRALTGGLPSGETEETPAPEAAPSADAPAPVAVTAEQAAESGQAEIEAEASSREADQSREKISVARDGEPSLMNNELRVHLEPGVSAESRERLVDLLNGINAVTHVSTQADGSLLLNTRFSVDDAAEAAREIARFKAVSAVAAPVDVRDRLFASSLPEKIVSHGKEHWSTGAVLVSFNAGATDESVRALIEKAGGEHPFRQGQYWAFSSGDGDGGAVRAGTIARELAADGEVASVEVHPNVAAALENRVKKPYPEAQNYDPFQAVLVGFKPETSEEAMKAYAEARRLRLVYPRFRGSETLALLEILRGADASATRQMLADETLDEGSLASEVRPFREQPGEAPLAPSAEARSRAEARRAAAAAAEEAARHTPRRDVQAEWTSYVQNAKMQDGTPIPSKMAALLLEFLKPVAKGPGEPRPPVVARSEEVKRMLPIVTSPRGMRNSVILVGGAGTGKTAVAEGLAEMIEDADHASANDGEQFLQFQRLKGRWLVELDINKILSSDEPVKVLNAVLDLLPRFNDPNPGRGNEIIVLMDEIQKFFLDNNGQKIANVLKGPLRDGKIAVIATTTDAEYKKFIESDDAFRRRLEKIEVAEPTVPQTIRILRAMKGWLQKIHDAVIPDEALVSSAKLADQFDKTNYNPDKAIKAVEDAAELSRPDNLRAAITLDIRETWNDLTVAANEARQTLIDKAVASTLALPVEAYNRIVELIKKAEALYAERDAVADGPGQVSVDVVKRVIAQKTGIGSGQLNLAEEDAARYVKMEEEVGGRVVNQERAIRAIADAIRRNKAGLSNPNRPMGKFLLVGPTGVGKTYLAKELARFLFNDPEAMTRFDMSEFMEEHSAMRLTGAPPSFVGYGEGGQLTEAVRKKPYSVLLFDEVEKAHPKVFDLLLQVLDDGRLTDGEGRTVDFKNTVILLTSNAGMSAVDGPEFVRRIRAARQAALESGAGQAAADAAAAKIEKEWDADIDGQVAEAIHGRFRPEFLNRLDDGPSDDAAETAATRDDSKKVKWIRVNRLRQQDMRKIAELQVKEFQRLLADRHDTDLEVDPSVIDFLSEEGYSPLYGARPMTGAIEKNIIDPLAKWILEEAASGNKTVRGGLIKITMKDGKVAFAAEVKPIKDVERATVKGAAESVAAELFSLIERLVGEGVGEEPSEGLFDKLLRAARPAATSQAASAEAPAARSFLAPDTALSLPAGARVVVATSNRPKAADPAMREEIKAVAASVASTGWPEKVGAALAVPAGQVGEGWLKQLVAFAKERADKAGAAAPVELASAVDAQRVSVLVHADAELTSADRAFLDAHFTGTPPASYEAAQQLVDNMNVSGSLTRNHLLLDLYRRLSEIPGARMGYAVGAAARGGKGFDVWLDIRKPTPEAPAAAPVPKASADPATPHELSEAAKTRALLMRFVDQSRMAESDQDGTSIRVAAAEGWSRLATKAELEEAHGWFTSQKWNEPDIAQKSITSHNALAMTAALLFERFGGEEDIARLENISANLNDYSHYQVPLHNALVNALAALYIRGGLAEVRRAQARAAQLSGKNKRDIDNAVARALGSVGYPADLQEVKASPEGLVALYTRMGRLGELRADFENEARWAQLKDSERMAALQVVAEGSPSDETFKILAEMLGGTGRRSAERVTRYQAAQAWATLVARGRRTKGLSQAMIDYVDKHGIQGYNDPWGILYAYVLAAQKVGGPDVLPALEKIMDNDPNAVGSNHEQMYFSTPEAWAKALIRNGKFAEYARKGLGADGAPAPSRLEKMLMSKDRPLLVSAALRAMALSRDPSYRPETAGTQTDQSLPPM